MILLSLFKDIFNNTMNLTNDTFYCILIFLDIDSIAKLARTCKTYQDLCKKHTLYQRLLQCSQSKSIKISLYHDNYEIVYREDIITYHAIKYEYYDVLTYLARKYDYIYPRLHIINLDMCKDCYIEKFKKVTNILPIEKFLGIAINYGEKYSRIDIRNIALDYGNEALYDYLINIFPWKK